MGTLQHSLILRRGSLLMLLLLSFAIGMANAQERTIKGKVTSEAEGPLPGVNILIQGTLKGTITDVDGNYSISVPGPDAVLVFSFVSYTSQSVTVGDQTTIDVALVSAATSLSEVVVVGYGTQRKKDITGAVSSVKSDDFNKGFVDNPSQLISGKAPGVMITNSSGDPGASSNIRIRGNSSIRAGNDPLIVVDGVPLSGGATTANGDLQSLGGMSSARNPLNFLNSNDIASIDILKDASATAIYGSRGSNGVILITTKQGSVGSNNVEYDASIGFGTIAKKIDVYNAAEFAAIAPPAQNLGGDVDAMDEITQRGLLTDHNLAFKGGKENLKYRFSVGYQNQEGIIKKSGLEKYSTNLNVTQELFDHKLRINTSIIASLVYDQYAPISTNAGFEGSLIGAALVWNPTRPLYKTDGTYDQFSASDSNPLAVIDYTDDKAQTGRFLGNISATLTLFEGLDYKFNVGYDHSNSERTIELSKLLRRDNIENRGYASITDLSTNNILLEHTLTYNKAISDKINILALAGYSYQALDRKGNNMQGRDFEYDDISYINQMQSISQSNRTISSYQNPTTELQSYFGRVNLNLFDKFLVTGTIRADGSSKFGTNNKYGYFPSFALAYRISEENFIPELFSDLKLRLGWGQTGNQEFDAGASQAQYEITQDGLRRSQYDNPDLKWETTTSINAGIDFALFNNRITGVVEYFNKNTVDILVNVEAAQPGPSGARIWQNLDANVTNKGFEFGLNAVLVKKNDLTWSVGGNAAFIENMFNDFGGIIETGLLHGQGITGTPTQRFISNQPFNVFYLLDFQGVDANGLGVYGEDKLYKHDPNPKTILGLVTNLSYKGWDLGANFNGAFGHYIYNNTATSVLVASNPTKGRNTSPDYTWPGESPDNALKASDRYLEKGDYLRLNNVTLSYTLRKAPLFFKAMRFSLTGQNLFVITNFTGFDPEVNQDKNIGGVPSSGIEYTPYPSARTMTFGLSVTL